jgi:hypothetical protein
LRQHAAKKLLSLPAQVQPGEKFSPHLRQMDRRMRPAASGSRQKKSGFAQRHHSGIQARPAFSHIAPAKTQMKSKVWNTRRRKPPVEIAALFD